MSNGKKQDAAASEGARRATEDAAASSASPGGGRWSAKRVDGRRERVPFPLGVCPGQPLDRPGERPRD